MDPVTLLSQRPRNRTNIAPFAKVNNFDRKLMTAINHLDLTQVERRLMFRKDFDQVRANNAIMSYRKYLYLAAKGHHCSPDHDTDEAWHAHILDMKKYETDCNATFGRMIYHFPNSIDEKGQTVRNGNDCADTVCHPDANCISSKLEQDTRKSLSHRELGCDPKVYEFSQSFPEKKSCNNCNAHDECSDKYPDDGGTPDTLQPQTGKNVVRLKGMLRFKTLISLVFPSN